MDIENDNTELINTKWTNHGDPTRSDFTTFLEIKDRDTLKTYDYYETPSKDSTPIFSYDLHLSQDTFLVDRRDTMPITGRFNSHFNNESIELYRFDYVNYMIEGDGCYILSEKHGVLGLGRFSGIKRLLTDWGTEEIDFNKILEKQKRHHNNK